MTNKEQSQPQTPMLRGTIRKVTRKSDAPGGPRTDSVTGFFPKMPEVGKAFVLFGSSLTPGCIVRFFETSEVKTVKAKDKDTIQFKTENSTYELTLSETQ